MHSVERSLFPRFLIALALASLLACGTERNAGSDGGVGTGATGDAAPADGSAKKGDGGNNTSDGGHSGADGSSGAAQDGGANGAGDDGGGASATDSGNNGGGVCGACTLPNNECVDGSHVRVFTGAGCDADACAFPSQVEACAYGCANGACKADPCIGVTCTPAATTCASSTKRRTSASTCVQGTCVSTSADEICANGCSGGACDAPTCGSSACNTPPVATCEDAQVLGGFASIGSCSGTCSYAAVQTWCSEGCINGACNAGSWEGIFETPESWISTAFAVDAAGLPHLVGADSAGNVVWRHLESAGWSDVQVDANLGYGVQVALALDANGSPLVAYFEPTNQRLRHAKQSGNGFAVEQVTNDASSGMNPRIAVDASGVEWIAYEDSNATSPGLRVAHGNAGNWTIDNLGTSIGGVAQLAFAPDGVLHLITGSTSLPSQPNYPQPAAFHSTHPAGGAWTTSTIDPSGLVFDKGMTFTANGDVVIFYGVVGEYGVSDELRMRREGSIDRDAIVESIDDLGAVTGPFLTFDGARDLKIILSGSAYVYVDGGFWSATTLGVTPQQIVDVAVGPDGGPRFFSYIYSYANTSGYAYVTPPACIPSCGGANCGSDGCGGSCGACTGNEACTPNRQCSPWHEATVNLPRLVYSDILQLSCATEPSGAHDVLVRYDFPEDYYASNSTQDELFYLTDKGRTFDAPDYDVALGVPSGSFTQADLVSSSLQIASTGAAQAIYTISPAGYQESITRTTYGSASWTSDWSTSPGNLSPSLYGVARNAADVMYVVHGFSSLLVDCPSDTSRSGGAADGNAIDARVAVDSKGNAHVLWQDAPEVPGDSSHLEYATNASGTWVSTAISGETATTTNGVFAPRIAVASDDAVHIAFLDGSDRKLTHGVLSGGTFTLETLDNGDSGDFELAIDAHDEPAIVSLASPGVVLYRHGAGGWTSDIVPTLGATTYPQGVWLSFDEAGNAQVFYFDAGLATQLRVAWRP